nr:hypothetical protein [Phycisphaerae bacterium]
MGIHHGLTHSPKATVCVLAAALLPDVDSPDRFRLTFDRDLVAQDAVGRTEKAEVFTLAPAWPGKWVWCVARPPSGVISGTTQ